jgi:hypothetical protein
MKRVGKCGLWIQDVVRESSHWKEYGDLGLDSQCFKISKANVIEYWGEEYTYLWFREQWTHGSQRENDRKDGRMRGEMLGGVSILVVKFHSWSQTHCFEFGIICMRISYSCKIRSVILNLKCKLS